MTRIPLPIIVEQVARDYGISPAQLTGQRRNRRILIPRYVAICIALEIGYSQTEVSRYLGRDPSTASAAARRFEEIAAGNPDLKERVSALRKRVERVADRESELLAAHDAVDHVMAALRKRIDRAIRRNPGAVLRRLADAFEEVKS